MMAGSTNAKQIPTPHSSVGWRSHVRPYALQKVLSGGFLIREKSSLQDNAISLCAAKIA